MLLIKRTSHLSPTLAENLFYLFSLFLRGRFRIIKSDNSLKPWRQSVSAAWNMFWHNRECFLVMWNKYYRFGIWTQMLYWHYISPPTIHMLCERHTASPSIPFSLCQGIFALSHLRRSVVVEISLVLAVNPLSNSSLAINPTIFAIYFMRFLDFSLHFYSWLQRHFHTKWTFFLWIICCCGLFLLKRFTFISLLTIFCFCTVQFFLISDVICKSGFIWAVLIN